MHISKIELENIKSHAASTFEFTRGSLMDRYVVLERLGAGGMSIIYAAYDPELRRRVANP